MTLAATDRIMTEIVPIPEPKGWPIINHLVGFIDAEDPTGSFKRLAEQLGKKVSIYGSNWCALRCI
jgi:hypothetical protein